MKVPDSSAMNPLRSLTTGTSKLTAPTESTSELGGGGLAADQLGALKGFDIPAEKPAAFDEGQVNIPAGEKVVYGGGRPSSRSGSSS